MLLQASDGHREVNIQTVLLNITKALQLLGNAGNHISAKRRDQVLAKMGNKYTSLSKESWDNSGKDLFGRKFEQRLEQRAETAKAISSAAFVPQSKTFLS